MTSEIDKYYQSGNTNEQELYKAILRDAGVDDRFIQSNIGFSNLSMMLEQVQIKHGDKFAEINQDNVNELVNTIKNEWEISEGHVLAEIPLSEDDKTSQFYAQKKQTYRTASLDLIGMDKVEVNQSIIMLESDFCQDAQNLQYADMPYILENGNRVEEYNWQEIYEMNPDGNDIFLEETEKRKISTLDSTEFQNFQQSMQTNTLSEIKNLQTKPDEYWGTINKSSLFDQLKLAQYSELFENSSGKTSNLSKEQINQMVEKIFSNPDAITQDEITLGALQQLGVSEELLKYPEVKSWINDMIEKTITDNPEIGDITTKDGIGKLIEQLDQDLIIKDNYIAGKIDVSEEVLQKNYETFRKDENEFSRQDAYEIYIDNNGLINKNQITLAQISDLKNDSNKLSWYNNSVVLKNNNLIRLKVFHDLYQGLENGDLTNLTAVYSEKYSSINGPAKPSLDLNSVRNLTNNSIEYWNTIHTTKYQPDIVVDEAKEDELIQSYDNYDITTEDMQSAHDTLEKTLEEEQNQQQEQTNENQER